MSYVDTEEILFFTVQYMYFVMIILCRRGTLKFIDLSGSMSSVDREEIVFLLYSIMYRFILVTGTDLKCSV
jgi:hypothetical protein